MSKYYEVSDDTRETFMNVFNKKSFPIGVKFDFLGSETQKELIKIKKISDDFAFRMGKDLMIYINEDIMQVFDEESVQILLEQEIDRVSINIESGKIKLVKPDLSTFSSLVNKYGWEKVSRANKVEDLYKQQVEDGTKDPNDDFIV